MTTRKVLAEAIDRLAAAQERDTDYRRETAARERWADPEFLAEIEAVRSPPHPLRFLAVLRCVPGLAAQFSSRVPAAFYEAEGNAFRVTCPCKGVHLIEGDEVPHGADCGRYFLWDGSHMRVAFTPSADPATPEEGPPPVVD